MLERILQRAIQTNNARADDTAETFLKRIEIHRRESEPIIEAYRSQGMLVDLDAEMAEESIVDEFMTKLRPSLGLGSPNSLHLPKIFSQ